MSDAKIEKEICKKLKKEVDDNLEVCKNRVEFIKTLMRFYVSMYATVPKEGRDILNDIENDMKTDMVNFALEREFIPN